MDLGSFIYVFGRHQSERTIGEMGEEDDERRRRLELLGFQRGEVLIGGINFPMDGRKMEVDIREVK